MEWMLKFRRQENAEFSNPRLSAEPAKLQKQPYGDLLFKKRARSAIATRKVEQALGDSAEHDRARPKGELIETAYAEIYPFLAEIAFHSRLVAFWQDRTEEQRKAFWVSSREQRKRADSRLKAALDSGKCARCAADSRLLQAHNKKSATSGLADEPVLPFGMLYNHSGTAATVVCK